MLILVATACACVGGLLDLNEKKIGKKNDAWYEANKSKIKLTTESLGHRTQDKYAYLCLVGSIENLSDSKLAGFVVEITIINNENNQEALKKRLLIYAPAFKSEKLKLEWLIGERNSELIECIKRVKNSGFSCEIVAAIADTEGEETESCFALICWAKQYYQTKEIWNATKLKD